MNAMLNDGIGRSVGVLVASAAAAMLVAPAAARAGGDWSFHIGIGQRVEPAYTTYVRAATATPRYELRTRRVWVEPQYADRVVTVTVPAVVETRDVPVYDLYGRVSGYRRVREIVVPAHAERRVERVVVRAGYYTTVTERVPVEPRFERRAYRRAVVATPLVAGPVIAVPGSGLHLGFAYERHGGGHHYRHHRRHHHRRLRRVVRAAFGY